MGRPLAKQVGGGTGIPSLGTARMLHRALLLGSVCLLVVTISVLRARGLLPGFSALRQLTPVQLAVQQPLGTQPGLDGIPELAILSTVSVPGIAGLFYVASTDHTSPTPSNAFLGDRETTCMDLAMRTPQPMTSLYKRRHAPPSALPGGVPRAFISWEGNISWEAFQAIPDDMRGPGCLHCGKTSRFQIIDGHVYRKGEPPSWTASVAEDMLLVAAHLWDLPDMDFILHFDDTCPPDGAPVIAYNICRDRPRGGFTYPSYSAWLAALGPQQLKVFYQCLADRYPYSNRRPTALWRGSTTDPNFANFNVSIVDRVQRMIIHKRFANDPVVDAKLVQIIFADDCTKAYIGNLAPRMELEDFNTAAVIIDIDGNGWSDRLAKTAHFNTPILKKASNFTGFFEHVLAPGHATEQYSHDLSDLQADPARLIQQAERHQGIAMAMLNQVAVAEATAYTLLQYAQKQTWQTVRDPTYNHIPFSDACVHNPRLPAELCTEMKARPARP